jgi:Mpv17 / PMP22 family
MHKYIPDDERIRTSIASCQSARGGRIRMFSSASVDLRQRGSDAKHHRGMLKPNEPPQFALVEAARTSRPASAVKAGAVALVSTVMLGFPGAAKASSIAVAGAAATTYSQTSLTLTTWQLVAALVLVLPGVGGAMAALVSRAAQAFFLWYMAQLAANPIATKSVTAGVIGAIGDYMAQGLDRVLESKSSKSQQRFAFRYDARRGLSCLLYGLFISGPLMHLAYDLFETILPVSTGAAGAGSGLAAISHVLADSVFLDSLFVATTFIVTGVMEGYNRRQLMSQLKSDYLPTLKASWVTSLGLLPIEFLCFRYLPVSLRVMAVNFIDVIWDTVISFMAHRSRGTYHHQEQELEEQKQAEQPRCYLHNVQAPVIHVEQPDFVHTAERLHRVLEVPQLAHA